MIQVVRRSIVDIYNLYSFSRESLAYDSKGKLYHLHNTRFEPGKFGQAVMVEEETTNKIETEGGGASKDWSKWSHWGNRTYWQSETQYDDPVMGKVFQGVCNNPTYLFDYCPYSITQDVVYTATIWLKASVAVSGLSATAYFINSSGSILGSTTKTINLTTEWQKFEWQITATATATGFGIGPLSIPAGTTVYAARPQLEQKPYATSFIDGTRAAETLTIPTAGVLNPQEGTVEFIFSPTTPQASTPWGRGFGWGDGYSNPVTKDDFRLVWGTGSGLNKILLSVAQANVGMRDFSVTLSRNLVVGNHYYVAIRWRLPGYLSLTIYDFGNGEVVSSSANDIAIAPKMDSPSVKAMLGTNANGREWVNWLFDDLRISSRARTDEEISAAYNSNAPLPVDADTTLKLNFDGPDAQRAAKMLVA